MSETPFTAIAIAAGIDELDGCGPQGDGTLLDLYSGVTERVQTAAAKSLINCPAAGVLVSYINRAIEDKDYMHPEVALSMRILVRRVLGEHAVDELRQVARRGMPRAFSDRLVQHLRDKDQNPENVLVAKYAWRVYETVVRIVSDDAIRTSIYTAPSTGLDHVPYVRKGLAIGFVPADRTSAGAALVGAGMSLWRLLWRNFQFAALSLTLLALALAAAALGLSVRVIFGLLAVGLVVYIAQRVYVHRAAPCANLS